MAADFKRGHCCTVLSIFSPHKLSHLCQGPFGIDQAAVVDDRCRFADDVGCFFIDLVDSRSGFCYTSGMSQSTQTDVLDRVLDPFTDCLTPEVAERIVDLRADAQTQARVDELADKANEGQLSPHERAEYDRYRDAFHFVTILQAKARRLLQRQLA
jgi:hypothetical protein